ncbi:UNVERIFIED_CONTAM: Senescence/dehydration-associated protein, chloroplastic [Sesamum latifolium]|uniref:Senescence/dehydration-associated protein, chloroplastic n=1 Tax=Sesamum latifolium TaxID=2727402 RepID=A0AAW2VH26_9LAMI
MNCFKPKRSKPPSPTNQTQEIPENKNVKHEILMRIPSCRVHLMDGGEALELAAGDFELLRISDENVSLATTIKVGEELQWPLTKDEPVVKLDASHYLFSLPMKDGEPLSYGVSFSDGNGADLGLLDTFLKENSLFSSSSSRSRKGDINWKEFAPAVDDYNSVLAKAIAGGTGQIVKGIFKCSNAYTNQVQKGGETILIRAAEEKNQCEEIVENDRKNEQSDAGRCRGGFWLGDGTGGSFPSRKTLLSMVPGEVLLASLDAVNKIIDAAEAAEKQAMTATSGAVTRMVTNRFGESAGEATEDALASAGHCAGTAWNVFKIRKAINPASSAASGALRNAAKSAKP